MKLDKDRPSPVINVVGPSGTGKTTWIIATIAALCKSGLRILSVKNCHHDPAIEPERKDSSRHLEAGAESVLLLSPGKRALLSRRTANLTDEIEDFRRRHGADLIIMEGGISSPYPKISIMAVKTEWEIEEPFPLLGRVGAAPYNLVAPEWPSSGTAKEGITRWLKLREAASGIDGMILAGGKGIRLGGVRKATLRHQGLTLLQRAERLLKVYFENVFVTTPRPEDLDRLEVPVLPDAPGVGGPLGGVLSALENSAKGLFILGVDHYCLSVEDIERVLQTGLQDGAAVARDETGMVPTISFVSRKYLKDIEQLAANEVRSLTHIFERISATEVELSPTSLKDVDTPEDRAGLAARSTKKAD